LMILRSRSIIFLISILVAIISLPTLSNAQTGKKVAVLYFTDHSKFDSGSGCGCLSFAPLNSIFGLGQRREKWNLASGFRDILNEELKNSGYDVVETSYVEEAIKESGSDNLSGLASKLGADVLIVGDVTKFEQHRTRVNSQGTTRAGTGGDMGIQMNLVNDIGGYYYSSSVKTKVAMYDSSGDEIDKAEVESKKDLQDFSMGVGPLSKSYQRGEATKNNKIDMKDVIVDYRKLDTMKFGTDEFKAKTLFGLATTNVIDQIVAKVGEHAEPVSQPGVEGKIIYIGDNNHLKENEVYIDLGASDGLVIGHKLTVYVEGMVLTDPDTGKELGKVPEKKVGIIKISKIEADHLSVGEIIEGVGQISKGNIVRPQ